MKLLISILLFIISIILLSGPLASASDFDWTKNLNIRADADPSGFRAQLSTRFKIGDAQVKVVLDNVGDPADAYMVLRLGEMSSKSTDYVLQKYKSNKNKGWGILAKDLGIKPGSKEFHALKRGHDLGGSYDKDQGGNHGHGKKGKGKNK